MQWYNYSYEPSQNVTIEMIIHTVGPEPITILDSNSGKVTFSVFTPGYNKPEIYPDINETDMDLDFRLFGASDAYYPGIKTDTIVYLPRGPNYTMTINNGAGHPNESRIVSKYTGGNLTLWINDPKHILPWYTYR